jgi:hypothetical protein
VVGKIGMRKPFTLLGNLVDTDVEGIEVSTVLNSTKDETSNILQERCL